MTTRPTNDDEFNKIRARFMKRASAPYIPAGALKLAYLIAFEHMDKERRIAFVGQQKLADELGGFSIRGVQKLLDALRPLGLWVTPGHGPGRASTYWIEETDEKANYSSRINRNHSSRIRSNQILKGELESHEKANCSSPPLKEDSKLERKRESSTLSPSTDASEAQQASKPKPDADPFYLFWQAYPRHVGKLAAEKAFAKARKHASADAIIAGARRYAAERAGQDPAYTKHPATWLNGGCWSDEPAALPPPASNNNSEGYSPERYGWKPGLPTDAELRAEALANMAARRNAESK